MEKYLIFAGLLSSAIFSLYFLLFRRIERKGRKYIVAGMFITFYTFLFDFTLITDNYNLAIYLFPFYYPLIFSLYPIIYHYLVSAVNDKNQRLMVKVFSLSPIIVLIFTFIIYIPLSIKEKYLFVGTDILEFNSGNSTFVLYQTVIYILYYLQLFYFIIIFIQIYLAHKKREKIITEKRKLYLPQWLFTYVSVIIMYEFVYTALVILDLNIEITIVGQSANLLFLFFIGFLGIKHDEMLLEMRLKQFPNKLINEKHETRNDILSDKKTEEIINATLELMEESKLFLNPALKLEHVAKKIHVPQKTLSEIINKHEGDNFSQFINKFRIREAKKILTNQKTKINDVYLNVGFYSRSTFNRSFKTIEGMTPTEFINSIK